MPKSMTDAVEVATEYLQEKINKLAEVRDTIIKITQECDAIRLLPDDDPNKLMFLQALHAAEVEITETKHTLEYFEMALRIHNLVVG